MRRLFLLVVTLVCLCGASQFWGQGTTSRVVGVVSDPTGAAVPNAKVTLTNQATGVSFTTTTTDSGTYVFEAVQVGSYSVTVETQGFKKFVSPDNRVGIGKPTTVNIALEIGAVTETVTVSGAAELVQTSTSGNFGDTVEQRVIQDLPIVGTRGRNPLDLVLSQPGVNQTPDMTGGGVNVHGARDRAWNYTLDGIDTNETSAGGSNFSPLRPNPDSLAEFRILTSNFTAEYGRNSGAEVAMVTRSGGNEFRGTAFWFYRTPRFNANEWENNLNGIGKRQFVQHIPGFSVGGPIRKNKTFFFVNAQWLRALETASRTRIVYTQQARQGIFRYVTGGNCGTPCRNRPAGVPGASVDASGNVLPTVNVRPYDVAANDPAHIGLDPTTQAEIKQTKLPNNFTVGDGLNRAGFNFSAPQREKQHDLVVKIDHNFNERHAFFARIAWGEQDTQCDRVNGGDPRFPGGPCVVNTERSPRNLAFNWRWTPTPRITNELVAGGNHFTFNFSIPSADAKRLTLSFDDITIVGEFEFGNLRTINTYQVVDNFSYVRGAHTFKTGINLRYQQHVDTRGSVAGANVSPLVDFDTSVDTVDPATFGIPSDINTDFDRPSLQNSINFLLGRVGNISQGFVQKGDSYAPGGTLFNFDARYPEYDFYWQDTWKARRNLTVDLGLRWELKLTPRDAKGLLRHPNRLVVAGAAPSNTLRWDLGSMYRNDVNNLAPSIGLAWDPTGRGKMAIRSNFRIAYDRINTFVLSSRVYQSIPGITLGVLNTSFGQAGGRLPNLPALSPAPSVKPSDFLQPPGVSLNSQTVVDPNFRSPKTYMWALSIQRELPWRTVVEASYIGRRAVGLFGAYDANQVEFRKNGFLDAFNIVKSGGQSDLINRLLLPDTRRQSTETGSDMVRRLFKPNLNLNSVAALAFSIASRIQPCPIRPQGCSIPELAGAGFGPFFFLPFPQFMGTPFATLNAGLTVIDSNDYSTYHALELKLERRFSGGLGIYVGYTFGKSLDTRSYDPTFSVVRIGTSQAAASTPFDILNRRLNYARSEFDHAHVLQGGWVWELPFGSGKRWARNANPFLDRVIGGWEVTGSLVFQSGRPFTVYAGSNTLTQLVQTPANCTGCTHSDGSVFDDASGFKFFFDANERAKFSTPAAGEFGNTGRNFFTGPRLFDMDMGILKSIRIHESHVLQYRADITNLTNTASFGLPTTGITSTTFGRIRDNVISPFGSRKIQMALKYYF